jgi:UDP-N-acetylmuramate dehydrogenase
MTFMVPPLGVQGKLKRRILSLMNITKNVPLSQYSTMRLGGNAAYAVGVSSRQEIVQAYNWAQERQLPTQIVGSGSNIIWRDEDFPGLLIVNQLRGFETLEEPDSTNVIVTIAAGENWDKVVERCVQAGLSGIECLSLVPGTAGATPIQNVGAYGQDISQTLVYVEAYDTATGGFATIPAADCAFGYRMSRFKGTDRGRFFIYSVALRLTHAIPQPPFYNALQSYLDEHNIREYTPRALRNAVIAIRSSKLPNPNIVANNGSFFANPIVEPAVFEGIAAQYPSMDAVPHWPTADGLVKLSAAWLLDQTGFKDFHDPETGMATWPAQPLVLVNEKATSTKDLLIFRQKILDAVQTKFGIVLEQEPELLPIL